jgi:hypothetical protein
LTVLMTEMNQWALARGIERPTFRGSDQSKRRWKPEEVLLREEGLVSPSPRGRAEPRAYQLAANPRAKLRT